MELIGCPETSVRNYHCLLCNNPEKNKSSEWMPEIAQEVPSLNLDKGYHLSGNNKTLLLLDAFNFIDV